MTATNKFEGLSSPTELLTTWKQMTEGQGLPELKIIWEFTREVMPLSIGVYIVNIAYEHTGQGIGHYVAIVVTNVNESLPLGKSKDETISHNISKDKTISHNISKNISKNAKNNLKAWYFDPIGTLPPRWLFEQFHKYYNFTTIDLTGGQRINGTSCGYRCLAQIVIYLIDGNDYFREQPIREKGRAITRPKEERRYLEIEQSASDYNTNLTRKQLDSVKKKTEKEFSIISGVNVAVDV